MNVRDPKFTARLEHALTILANQPTRSLGYLEGRFDLESGDLQTWLNEFNGGQKALKFDRIHAVKRDIGGMTVTPAKAAAPAPIMRDASENAHKSILNLPAAAAPAPTVAKPQAAVELVDDGQSPWSGPGRRFRSITFKKWRPVLVKVLEAGATANANAICDEAGLGSTGFYGYCVWWIGQDTKNPPEKIRRFLTWADERCSAEARGPRSAAESPAAPAAAAPTVAEPRSDDPWQQWRSDAIAALVAMQIRTRDATIKVDAAINKLGGKDVDTGELVKLALQQNASLAAPSKKLETASGSQPLHVCVNGATFKLEISVRLVPVAGEGK